MRFLVDHERTGLLSGPGDARALAANVVRVLRDPALGAWLATNAFEESRQYHWTAVRQQWLSVYQELVRGNRMTAEQSPIATAGQSGAKF